jgi:flagellar biosynthesis protein FlhA
MSIGEAGKHFSLLTVGDGLSAQIPALMISVATGIIVTRTASEKDLGNDIVGQITGQKKAPLVAGVAMIVLAVIPGLPKIPFVVIGGLFLMLWRSIKDRPTAAEAAEQQAQLVQAEAQKELPAPKDAALEALQVDALELAIGFGLVPLVDDSAGGSLLARVKTIRRQIASELGVVIPPVRIHDEVGLDAHEYVVKVRGADVAQGRILAGHQLAMDPGDAVGQLQGVPTTEPAFGIPATWIPDAARAEAEALGYTVVDRESVIVTHLTETIRANAGDMLTRQDTRQLLDQLKETNAAVVEEVVPDVLQLGEVQRVLQNLLREGVSVRDLGTIVEAIGDKARVTRDPSLLAEYARQALGRAITSPHLDAERKLRAISLDPMVEQEVSDSIAQTADGEYLVMEPSRAQLLVSQLKEQVDGALAHGGRPVLLCSARVRRHLRRLCEQSLPQLPVCSYNEVMPGIRVETVGVVAA